MYSLLKRKRCRLCKKINSVLISWFQGIWFISLSVTHILWSLVDACVCITSKKIKYLSLIPTNEKTEYFSETYYISFLIKDKMRLNRKTIKLSKFVSFESLEG